MSMRSCLQKRVACALAFPVMLHDQQFEKIWWLASQVSEEECASLHIHGWKLEQIIRNYKKKRNNILESYFFFSPQNKQTKKKNRNVMHKLHTTNMIAKEKRKMRKAVFTWLQPLSCLCSGFLVTEKKQREKKQCLSVVKSSFTKN